MIEKGLFRFQVLQFNVKKMLFLLHIFKNMKSVNFVQRRKLILINVLEQTHIDINLPKMYFLLSDIVTEILILVIMFTLLFFFHLISL